MYLFVYLMNEISQSNQQNMMNDNYQQHGHIHFIRQNQTLKPNQAFKYKDNPNKIQVSFKSLMQSKSLQQHSQVGNKNTAQITTVQRKNHTLLRINADDYSTKHMVIFWVCYIGLVVLISCLTLALPRTFVTLSNNQMLAGTQLQGCPNPIGFNPQNFVTCDPITRQNSMAGLLLRNLSPNNQFLLVYVNFVLESKAVTIIDIPSINVTLQYYELGQKEGQRGLEFFKTNQLQNQETQIYFKSIEAQRIYERNGYSLKGYRKFFGYKKYIEQQNSLIHFKFNNWPLQNIKEVYLEVTTVTPDFSIFAIVYRYMLFALSISTGVAYFLRYRLIPQHLVTLQQKMVLYLSIFTIMFNDPLYAATILAPNGFTAFCSVAFIVNFLTFLIAFWMIFIERILYETGKDYQNVINRKKIAYFVVLYICLFVLEFQVALLRFSDRPMLFGNDIKSGGIVAFQIISFIVFAGGLTYIAVQYVRTSINFFSKIWRNQMFLVFSFIFFLVIVIMLVINGFSVYDYTGNRILILFGFMNMYTVYLQYMYSINEAEVKRLEREKIIGGGQLNRNQVETVISNFGGEQIMVDLDSEMSEQGHYHAENKNPNKLNKYNNNIKERIESRDEQQNEFEENTMENLNQKKEAKNQQEMYSLED